MSLPLVATPVQLHSSGQSASQLRVQTWPASDGTHQPESQSPFSAHGAPKTPGGSAPPSAPRSAGTSGAGPTSASGEVAPGQSWRKPQALSEPATSGQAHGSARFGQPGAASVVTSRASAPSARAHREGARGVDGWGMFGPAGSRGGLRSSETGRLRRPGDRAAPNPRAGAARGHNDASPQAPCTVPSAGSRTDLRAIIEEGAPRRPSQRRSRRPTRNPGSWRACDLEAARAPRSVDLSIARARPRGRRGAGRSSGLRRRRGSVGPRARRPS